MIYRYCKLAMKNNSQKSIILFVGISIILIAVLMKRLFIRNMNIDYFLGMIAGFAVMVVCFLIFRIVMKKKK